MSNTDPSHRTALFISHATPEDNHFVRWLGAKLNAMGYEVWADVMRLHGGADWSRKLEDALRNRAVKLLLVCSQSGLEKQGVRNEIEIGVSLTRKLVDDTFIIPLRLEPYEPPFRIAHLQYIDFKDSWLKGLEELNELLQIQVVPMENPGQMQTWLDSHSEGSARLLQESEPLVSNWLEIQSKPDIVYYCEPPVGASLERFQSRLLHSWPLAPHRGGVITFANPDHDGMMGKELVGKVVNSIKTDVFLSVGWAEYGIERVQANKIYTDIALQAFEKYCINKGLKGFLGSGNRLSWWGDIKTAPLEKVKFDWGYRRGARQIIGISEKRKIHWHYAISAHLRTTPLHHLRIAARLVFSENGLDPIEDKRRTHTLRRSLAKGWRNARWRDMLCAYLWWLSSDKNMLNLPVADGAFLSALIPPMQFSCPVSINESVNDPIDEDDPDVPEDDLAEDIQYEDEE